MITTAENLPTSETTAENTPKSPTSKTEDHMETDENSTLAENTSTSMNIDGNGTMDNQLEVETNNSNEITDIIIANELNSTHSKKFSDEKSPTEKTSDQSDHSGFETSHSPTSLRRSTRVSALKAQKKFKKDEDQEDFGIMVQDVHMDDATGTIMTIDPKASPETSPSDTNDLMRKKLKRKLVCAGSLDQYDCKFGIRMDGEDVVELTEGSEISSLDEEDVSYLRDKYEKQKQMNISSEEKLEREYQIKELEATLRLEEAKLAMMKKIRQSQQHASIRNQQEQIKQRLSATHVGQNTSGQSYKPPIVVPSNQQIKVNGTTSVEKRQGKGRGANSNTVPSNPSTSSQISFASLQPNQQKIIQMLNQMQNPQQLNSLLRNLSAPTASALTELLRQCQQHQQNQSGANSQQHHLSATPGNSNTSQQQQQQTNAKVKEVAALAAAAENAKKAAHELTQQKIAAARLQMRRELEQQIMKLPPPTAPVPDMYFIPNGNQPDFLSILGLDLTVQRVLRDKNVFKKNDFPPYQCEECETDFTTSWKAICDDKDEYHLYCENCVRQAQKRKIRQDYSQMLKRAFLQIQEKEKVFEKQVQEGKFTVEPVLPPAAISLVQQQQAAASSMSGLSGPTTKTVPPSKSTQHHNSINHSIASMTAADSKSAIQVQTAISANNIPSTALNLKKTHASTSGITQNNQQVPMSNSSQKGKRANSSISGSNVPSVSSSTASNAANTNATNNILANLGSFQQQLAAAMMNPLILRQMGPLAAAFSNPLLMQQLLMQMLATQRISPQSGSSAGSNQAMSALLQAVQQSAAQQTNTTVSGGSGSISQSASNNTAAVAAMAAMNPLLALNTQMSNTSNPQQILRQFQAAYAASANQMKASGVGSGGGKKG